MVALAVTFGACSRRIGCRGLAATSALSPPQVLNYQAYVGGKGKANPKPLAGRARLHQRPGRAAELQLPAADARHRGRREDGERRARRRARASDQARTSASSRRRRRRASAAASRWRTTRPTKAILYGAVVVGNQSIYATLKGAKPIVGGVTANPADPTAKNAFFLNGSQTSVLGPFATYTKKAFPKVKTVAIVYPNQPGADSAAFALRRA